MPFVEFAAQSAQNDGFIAATNERLVNFFPEPLPMGARGEFQLRTVLGTETLATTTSVFIRAMGNLPEYDSETGEPTERLIAATDGNLVQIGDDGTTAVLGAIVDDERTTISGNNGDITAVAGGRYFRYNGTAVSEPTAGAFSNFGAVEFLGDYTILTERNGRRFQWSALANPASLPGLNFATAESRDDVILRPLAITGNLWIFKATSIEIWARTGQASENAFSLLPGAVIETGLLGFGLVTKIPNGAFFVGDDGICYITGGTQQLQAVSTPTVNQSIENGTPTDCFYYEDEGHKFCVLRFDNRPAWVYDLATGLWHERATGDSLPWGARSCARYRGKWRFAGYGGEVRTAVRNARDSGEALIRRAVSRPLEIGGDRYRVAMLEFRGRVGSADIGRDASMMVRISRDGGHNWTPTRTRSMGDLGEYYKRMVFRNFGQARVMSAEVTISDATDLRLMSRARVELA